MPSEILSVIFTVSVRGAVVCRLSRGLSAEAGRNIRMGMKPVTTMTVERRKQFFDKSGESQETRVFVTEADADQERADDVRDGQRKE